jgi:hypothetical protein
MSSIIKVAHMGRGSVSSEAGDEMDTDETDSAPVIFAAGRRDMAVQK